jgi:hypothetical protein
VHCVVAFGPVKEVMGWRYFADVASMSFSEKKTISQLAIWFLWHYGVKKSYHEQPHAFVFAQQFNKMSKKLIVQFISQYDFILVGQGLALWFSKISSQRLFCFHF